MGTLVGPIRIEGFVFRLIDIAVKPANIRNAPFLPGFGKVQVWTRARLSPSTSTFSRLC